MHKIANVNPEAGKQPHGNGLYKDSAFRVLVDSVQDYAIFMLDAEGRVATWNTGAERIKGYRAEEIIGKHFSQFYPPEAQISKWPDRELELAAAEGRFSDEGWRVRKDGTMFWANVLITALRDANGDLYGFAKVTRDLTERQEREEKIQRLNSELRNRLAQLSESQKLVEARTIELQNLSGRLMQMQDEERRRIARELHDSLGQDLAVLKMTLGTTQKTGGDLSEAVKQAMEQTDAAIKSVRSMSYLLHPPLLDEVGLMAALHWLVDGVEKRIGLQIQLVTKPLALPRLSRDIEITIFRIIQEALTNVYRHSESAAARIDVDYQADRVVLRIRDYGKGFKPDTQPEYRVGVGLSGMRERVKQFGGQFRIIAAEPGAMVEAIIPLYTALP